MLSNFVLALQDAADKHGRGMEGHKGRGKAIKNDLNSLDLVVHSLIAMFLSIKNFFYNNK